MTSIGNQKGIALFTALLMSLVIMAMVTGVLYFVTQSVKMSGAGKRYATADDAAAGSVDIMKDAINFTIWGGNPADIGAISSGCFANAVLLESATPCGVTISLPGEIGDFTATVTVQRLFSRALPGGRLEFSRSAGGAPSTTIFYKITTRVQGPGNSTAENSALYRWAG